MIFRETAPLRRERLIFHGRVQGVGFRHCARMICARLSLSGWVRNEEDGTVLMELQGEPAAIEEFLSEISEQRFIRIEALERERMAAIEEKGFRILAY